MLSIAQVEQRDVLGMPTLGTFGRTEMAAVPIDPIYGKEHVAFLRESPVWRVTTRPDAIEFHRPSVYFTNPLMVAGGALALGGLLGVFIGRWTKR